uniref:Putative secreted protein n=1 Tax=Anopheles marajoara TaxID=58244 RepID=A0A2M4C9I6_9DIPT
MMIITVHSWMCVCVCVSVARILRSVTEIFLHSSIVPVQCPFWWPAIERFLPRLNCPLDDDETKDFNARVGSERGFCRTPDRVSHEFKCIILGWC